MPVMRARYIGCPGDDSCPYLPRWWSAVRCSNPAHKDSSRRLTRWLAGGKVEA